LRRSFLVGVSSVLLASGCAAIPPSQLGQTAGTIAGAALAPGIGAPIGALVGLLAGMVVQGEVDKATEKRERKELGEQLTVKPSSASESELERPLLGEPIRVWVDETVQEGRLIAGHFDARYLP
jgi:hypothetical protein